MKADQAQTAYFNEANAANETRERETRGGRRKTFSFLPFTFSSFLDLPDHLDAHAPRRRRHALRHAPQRHVRRQVGRLDFRDLDHRRGRDAADDARRVARLLRSLGDARSRFQEVRGRRGLHGVVVGLVGVGRDADRDRGPVLRLSFGGVFERGRGRGEESERASPLNDQANSTLIRASLSFRFFPLFSASLSLSLSLSLSRRTCT